MKNKLEYYINKFNEKHNSKYAYSLITSINFKNKIDIICPKHGVFSMLPANHLRGQGCPKCSHKGLIDDEWIEEFKMTHKNENYDYSKFHFINSKTASLFICPIHGEFKQTPYKHILGQGCPKCASIKRAENKKLTTNEFISRSKIIFNNFYDYSKTEYKGTYDKLTIICPKHGEFTIRANDHLNGHG